MICYGNVLSDELVGVIPVSRVPVIELTVKSPNFSFLTASRSIESTSLSLTVELNFMARSTITLPHLGMKREKVQTKLQMTKMNRELIYFLNFQMVESHKTKHLIK